VICAPAQDVLGPLIAGVRVEGNVTQAVSADIGVSAVPGQSFVAMTE
jgi:hypothetical protein